MDRNGASLRAQRSNPGDAFSLIELLIAIALSLVLLFGLVNLLSHFMKSYREQQAMQTLYDDAKFITRIWQKDLAPVGDLGCQKFHEQNQIDNLLSTSLLTDAGIKIYQVGADPLPALLSQATRKKLLLHSIVLVEEHAVWPFASVQYDPARQQFLVANSTIQRNDPVLLTSCDHAWVFKASQISSQQKKLYLTPPFIIHDPSQAYQLAQWQTTLWFVMKSHDRNYGLYRLDFPGETAPVEFISHVTGLQAQAVFPDGTVMRAAATLAWQDVSVIRIKLDLQQGHIQLHWPVSIGLMKKCCRLNG